MAKLNIETANKTTFKAASELSGKSFLESHAILSKAFMRRLNLERELQGKTFDAKTFWADNAIAEEVILSASRTPLMKVENNVSVPVLRKGKPVFSSSRLNARVMHSASSIVRFGVRTEKALRALNAVSTSIEDAVKNADRFGAVLRLVPRFAKAGLVATNAAGNDAKNAAIEAYKGETATGFAKKALISSLYGKSVTSVQVTLVIDALKAFEAAEEPRTALTFDTILGTVTTIKAHKAAKSRKAKAPKPAGAKLPGQPEGMSAEEYVAFLATPEVAEAIAV